MNDLKKEIDILKKCRNDNIVSYFGYCFKDQSTWVRKFSQWKSLTIDLIRCGQILMDYCGGGSVLDIMEVLERPLTEEQIIYILRETLKGLIYLHSKGIIHRDVKSANILLTETGAAKIGRLIGSS